MTKRKKSNICKRTGTNIEINNIFETLYICFFKMKGFWGFGEIGRAHV